MGVPTFVMMCGLVGSGKTVKAQELAKQYDATVFSSDSLREELFGDVNEQSRNQELFTELHKRIKDCLREGKSAIMDSTNISYKKRMSFLAELKNIPCKKICVLMATPYEECLRRNAERERKVSEEVINRMYRSIDISWYYEGWDEIQIIYADGFENYLGNPYQFILDTEDFNQDNPHHNLTLGKHCLNTFREISNSDYSMRALSVKYAALLHDNGKVFTKQFKDSRGNDCEYAHYYNHERCGSYCSLFYKLEPFCDPLYVAVLIRWHMQPYFWEKDNNDKLQNKYKTLWGEKLYQDVMKLHEADRMNH